VTVSSYRQFSCEIEARNSGEFRQPKVGDWVEKKALAWAIIESAGPWVDSDKLQASPIIGNSIVDQRY